MDRRTFVRVAVGGALATAGIAGAQTGATVRRIGILRSGAPDSPEAVRQIADVLRKFGWVEGQNLVVERRFADGRPERLRSLADELVRLKVELIVTTGTAATLAAKSATSTIPIVFWSAGDPVGSGLVASLARPGGNVTGFSIAATEMNVKRLAVLRECLPAAQRFAILENAANPSHRGVRREVEQACRALGIQPLFVEVAGAGNLTKAVAEAVRLRGQGLLVSTDSLFYDNRGELMHAALARALPVTTSRIYIRETGALVSYDPLEAEEDERAASFVDRILRGAKPAELPVEQPTKFELMINLKTAKALRIAVPPPLLARAQDVIE